MNIINFDDFACCDKNLIFFAIDFWFVTTTPPLAVVIILFPLKLKQPTFPKEPSCLSLNFAPKDSAASSTTGILNFFLTLLFGQFALNVPKYEQAKWLRFFDLFF